MEETLKFGELGTISDEVLMPHFLTLVSDLFSPKNIFQSSVVFLLELKEGDEKAKIQPYWESRTFYRLVAKTCFLLPLT